MVEEEIRKRNKSDRRGKGHIVCSLSYVELRIMYYMWKGQKKLMSDSEHHAMINPYEKNIMKPNIFVL